ncbi:NAD(P)-binding protein [Linderina pennispora]|uniref:NAD(P)-binding protein n=1 Tax=Linderina pennispora TaxID=61395 RepID=A0A1Y1WGA1_9FUNG|nr:NAD(P)-binding protein [Linderina pennispora]ORX72425.1 NAD(P)-binding protein [Linderina pennispora]
MSPKVIITAEFEGRGFDVIGTAFSRARGELRKLDLSDTAAVAAFVGAEEPQAIIHCAAEKRPDVAEQNKEATERLNAEVPGHLAALAKQHGAFFVYISTDYVFDGTSPPYQVDDKPNPLNFYGRTKLAGERAVQEANPQAAILRVPILYGSAEDIKESAVNLLLGAVKDASKETKMDDYQKRFPTNTLDVARVLADMAEISVGAAGEGEEMTKYAMCQVFAEILGNASIDHLVPVRDKPTEAVASRPDNTQLSTEALEQIGISYLSK